MSAKPERRQSDMRTLVRLDLGEARDHARQHHLGVKLLPGNADPLAVRLAEPTRTVSVAIDPTGQR